MKRLVTITVIFLLVSLSLTAKSTTQTMWAFGGARFALGSDSDSFLGNPALLASGDRTTQFHPFLRFEDSAESWDLKSRA